MDSVTFTPKVKGCTNGTRVFVHQDCYGRFFLERLLERSKQTLIFGVNPLDPKRILRNNIKQPLHKYWTIIH